MRRALGKGLSQLLGDEADAPVSEVSVNSIVPNPRQPRREFDQHALDELAASIKEHGVIQPLIVRQLQDDRYELIAGERRLRAAKLAGLKAVPITVRSASAQASLEVALVENVQREDINALECALAYRALVDNFGLTQDQIASKVGKTRAAIANTLRILKLPSEMQEAIASGLLTEGHARALLMVESPIKQAALFDRIVQEAISVREAERIARGEARSPQVPKEAVAKVIDPDLAAVQNRISDFLGAKIKLETRAHGGRLSIDYYSDDELEGILRKMGISL
ncbi:MAG: ParB/RepB/Spo0J family partition protein [Armatimonadetes bacterium]|nr:ParB/RepB/Spo0J family partition protein [Armatimonadota bacterium]